MGDGGDSRAADKILPEDGTAGALPAEDTAGICTRVSPPVT